MTRSKLEEISVSFVKQARDLLLELPLDERANGMNKIASFVSSSRRAESPADLEHGRELMAKLAFVMEKQGLMKKADLKAPSEYISDKLPGEIINGRHALYVTIRTFQNAKDDYSKSSDRYDIVDGSLPMIKEKIREL